MGLELTYYCDCYPAIGFGHLKRGIDIINSILRIRPDCRLAFCGRFSSQAEAFLESQISGKIDILPEKTYPVSKLSVLDTMFDPNDPEYMDEKVCSNIKMNSSKFFLISGLLHLDVPFSVDALINHCPDISLSGNTNLTRYTGFDYSPVNLEFQKRREESVNYKKDTILCIIGGNKNQYGPELLVSELDKHSGDTSRFVCILSPLFPVSEKKILEKQYPKVKFYQNVPDLSPLFQRARAMICTYGHTVYESLFFHIPTFIVSYKQFQKEYADRLEKRSLAVSVGFFEKMDRKKMKLIYSDHKLHQLAYNAKQHFSTSGIENIVKILMNELKGYYE